MLGQYEIEVLGHTLFLPYYPLDESRRVPYLITVGNVAFTEDSSAALIEMVPEFDVILTDELQGLPLAYAMTKAAGKNRFVIARKEAKSYMDDAVTLQYTAEDGTFIKRILTKDDAEFIKNKRVLLVDDVVFTGETMRVLEKLSEHLGGYVVGKAAFFELTEPHGLEELATLAKLPVRDLSEDSI